MHGLIICEQKKVTNYTAVFLTSPSSYFIFCVQSGTEPTYFYIQFQYFENRNDSYQTNTTLTANSHHDLTITPCVLPPTPLLTFSESTSAILTWDPCKLVCVEAGARILHRNGVGCLSTITDQTPALLMGLQRQISYVEDYK